MRETYWQKSVSIVGPSNRVEFSQVGQQGTRNALEQFILDRSDSSTRLLDAGCSTGVEGYRLFNKGYCGTYVGMDSNHKALALALENLQGFPASLTFADLERTGFPDNAFDIVLTKDVIEHAPSFEGILGELCRVSRGWLILSMFIRMGEEPTAIQEGPPGLFHNRYQREAIVSFLAQMQMGPPLTIYESGEDEVLVFRKRLMRPV